MQTPKMTSRLAAEFLGTFWLVLGGCGSAVLAANFLSGDGGYNLGIGFLGVSLAFGLTVLTMVYAVGPVSGGHFNPAVTVGLAVGRRFEWKDAPAYIVTQIIGGSLGAVVLWVIANGQDGFSAKESGFATNGYGDLSPGGYALLACVVCEIVMTAIFLYVILGATDERAPVGFAPIAIGLSLTLIHLVSIPVTNTSVNPARSLAVAWFVPDALAQVWLFLIAPVIGAAIAGASYAFITGVDRSGIEVSGEVEPTP